MHSLMLLSCRHVERQRHDFRTLSALSTYTFVGKGNSGNPTRSSSYQQISKLLQMLVSFFLSSFSFMRRLLELEIAINVELFN